MKPQDFFSKKYKSSVTHLFKDFIAILEDLKEDHSDNFDKLYKSLPEEGQLIEMADYFDDSKFERLRKRVLDIGNDCIRSMDSDIDKLEIHFKFKQ